MVNGASVVAAARGWLGTRFQHQGRVKKTVNHKGGVDCLGLLVGVAREMELALPNGTLLFSKDENDYSHYPDTDYLQEKLGENLDAVKAGDITPGDVALLKIDNNPQHLAIIGDTGGGYSLIHAYAPAHGVVEHMLDEWWHERIVAVYRLR